MLLPKICIFVYVAVQVEYIVVVAHTDHRHNKMPSEIHYIGLLVF